MNSFMAEKNIVWDHFCNNEEEGLAICKKCSARLRNSRTFNLNVHMKKVHGIDCSKDNSSLSSASNSSSLITRKRPIKISVCKKDIFRSYIGLVTENSVPFNVLNSANMRAFTDPICEGLSTNLGKKFRLNADNCKKTLKLVAENIRKDILKDLKNRPISLKIDSATRLSRNIFGISAQFIEKGKIMSRILGMTELKGIASSTSKNLATEILKTLNKFDIGLQQIVSITSDNGANMMKATKILSQCSSMEDYNEDDVDLLNDAYMQNIALFDDFPDIHVGDIQICRCAAHTAQLCALDVTKYGDIKKYLLNCRNLAKFCKKSSNGYREKLELKKMRVPQLDCPTRWGSTYQMVNDLKEAKTVLMQLEPIKNKCAEEDFENNDSLWNFIESYCLAFSPMQKTILKFQQEQLHYGDFYAQWLKCKILIKKLIDSQENTASFTHTIGRSLLQAMDNRSKKLMSNESLLATLFLDPRFHHTLEPSQKNYAICYLKKLWDKVESLKNNDGQSSASISLRDSRDIVDEEDALLNEFLASSVCANETNEATTDVYTKIEKLQLPFLPSDTNVLDFWKQKVYSDPELHALSNICFAIPPTQVTIERAFSSLKLILTDNRNRLSESTLDNILLIKLNPSYLDDAIANLPIFEEESESN